jgi:hypothetical protein
LLVSALNGIKMLKHLSVEKARFISFVANIARMQRDAMLGNVAERDLGGLTPARGEHNPMVDLGVEPLPDDIARPSAKLREAVNSLSELARRELYTLMRIGQGHLAAKKWRQGLSDAELLGDSAVAAAVVDDPDLHDHISKGLYAIKLTA